MRSASSTVEQSAVNRSVVGSNPMLSAILWPVGEAVNSYPFQGYIHAFEPRTGHQLQSTELLVGSVFCCISFSRREKRII